MTRATVESVPGDTTSQREAVDDIIEYVDEDSPLNGELADWMVQERFSGMEMIDSAEQVISFLDDIGILDKHGEQMQVGHTGARWKLDSSPDTFFSILDEGAIGFDALLDRLARGECTLTELHTHLITLDEINWTREAQTRNRLKYLRSCDLIEFDDGTYSITDDGRRVIQGRTRTERFRGPPSLEQFENLIDEADADPTFEIYLANHGEGSFEGEHLNLPVDTETGINPREISEDAIIFHLVDGEIRGFSRQSEPGIDTDIEGINHHRIPLETRFFEEPVYLYTILGELVNPSIRLETESYPFSETGLKEQAIGELGAPAAGRILDEATSGVSGSDAIPEYCFDDLPSADDIEGLYYPGNMMEEIISQAVQALRNEKHLVLVGPPGTGKSKLADQIANHIVEGRYKMVTATANWSTFDTIGGYQPEGEAGLNFVPGVFLERFKDENQNPDNEWLIIDELNRANIDKAFGSLFSALVGDSVTTSFKDENDEEVEIISMDDEEVSHVEENKYYIPESWRLIATMNTQDKMSLYDLSYAFIRRFAFIHVGAPKPDEITDDDIEEYLDRWGFEVGDGPEQFSEDQVEQLKVFWKTIQRHRKLGPAVIEDIAKILADDSADFTQPIKMFVIPQLEDLPRETQRKAIDAILQIDGDVDINGEEIREFASDYFGISKSRLTDTS